MGCQVFRTQNPAQALGLAVSHLMTRPAFARLSFGPWSKILAGQINRGHYWLIADDAKRVVGFLGWALAQEAAAEAWLADDPGAVISGGQGDCIIFNAWSGDDPGVRETLLAAARQAAAPHRLIYFKRFYARGGVRPVRLLVTDFVQNHANAESRLKEAPLPAHAHETGGTRHG